MPGPWKLEPPLAVLAAESLSGVLNVVQPQGGLAVVHPYFARHEDVRLFQIHIGKGGQDEYPITDAYTRLSDLIVSYAESAPCAFGAQIYWRFLDGARRPELLAGMEIIISAQTSLLDAEPEITTSSRIPATQVLRLSSAETGDFRPIAVDQHAQAFEAASGPGCFLFRAANEDFSYVEMIHPTDFSSAELSAPADQEARVALRLVVIRRWMEKGVIVRARVRGAWVPRSDDTVAATCVYQDFCNAKIPLTV